MKGDNRILEAVYIGSYPNERLCPKTEQPEYAFIGRSNVGKSSLINMITGKRELARTSKQPGKTQSINIFHIDRSWYLADLPGYGYAKISKTERKRWQKMIESYLMFRPNLASAFVLIDCRHSLQEIDREFINWLGTRNVPFCIVYTKADKIKKRLLQGHLDRIREDLLETWDELPPEFVTSSEKDMGRDELLQYIADWNQRLVNN